MKSLLCLSPVLVHREGPEHYLQPDHGLLEEQLSQGRVTAYACCEHVTIDLKVHETFEQDNTTVAISLEHGKCVQ